MILRFEFADHQQFVSFAQLVGDRAVVVHIGSETDRIGSEYVRLPLEALILQLHHRRIANGVRLLILVVVRPDQFVFVVRFARDHTGSGGLDRHLKSGQIVLQREPSHAAVRSNVVGRLFDADHFVVMKHFKSKTLLKVFALQQNLWSMVWPYNWAESNWAESSSKEMER